MTEKPIYKFEQDAKNNEKPVTPQNQQKLEKPKTPELSTIKNNQIEEK